MWRGQVASATRGKRGQQFFVDLIKGLEAMPEKRLLAGVLQCEYGMCAMGVVGNYRGIDLSHLNPDDASDENAHLTEDAADQLNIARPLALEVAYFNDDQGPSTETPEQRWLRIRQWAKSQIKDH
jgi:hypothetical protein